MSLIESLLSTCVYFDIGGVPGYHTNRDRLIPSDVTSMRHERHVEGGAAAALLLSRFVPLAAFALAFGA